MHGKTTIKIIDSVSKNTQISNSMKFRLVEAEFLHADRRKDGRAADMMKLIVAFHKFAKAPKNETEEMGSDSGLI